MKKQTKLGLVLAAAAVLSVSVASLVSARGWVQRGADWFYVDNDGEAITDKIQSSGNAKFYLGEDGAMQKDYFLEDYENNTYYFGSNGAMVTNTWVAIESSRVDNQGDYVPDNYWYYFQASGKAMKAASGSVKKTTIDGKKYCFNDHGQMLTGWVDGQGNILNTDDAENPFKEAVYYCGGDNDGVMRTGWVTYYDGYDGDDEWLTDKTNLYFYFNTSSGKKENTKTKKINGKTYAFSQEGVMMAKWDVFEHPGEAGNNTTLNSNVTYFSGEDDGHQVKKGWVYAVPAADIDQSAHDDDEEKYMYFGSSGNAEYNKIKKINGKYYVFAMNGIMKTGLIAWAPSSNVAGKGVHRASSEPQRYVCKVDFDYADGSDMSKKGKINYDDNSYLFVDPQGYILDSTAGTTLTVSTMKASSIDVAANKPDGDVPATLKDYGRLRFHFFGEDGARKTGTNTLAFNDDNYTFQSNAQGDKGSGNFNKKYYSLGIQCKASSDIKYGLFVSSVSQADWDAGYGAFKPQSANFYNNLLEVVATGDSKNIVDYTVLSTGGSKIKGATTAKKDADGNYWYIHKANGSGFTHAADRLVGVWTCSIKNQRATFTTKEVFTKAAYPTALDAFTACAGTIYDPSILITPAKGTSGAQANGIQTGTISNAAVDWSNSSANESSLKFVYEGLWFQGDYNGSSNKWIPFGIYDDAHNTCNVGGAGSYVVTPNNDYFLNCYWD